MHCTVCVPLFVCLCAVNWAIRSVISDCVERRMLLFLLVVDLGGQQRRGPCLQCQADCNYHKLKHDTAHCDSLMKAFIG